MNSKEMKTITSGMTTVILDLGLSPAHISLQLKNIKAALEAACM
jgi:hypothetical protein